MSQTVNRSARMRDVFIVAFVKWGAILMSFAATYYYSK